MYDVTISAELPNTVALKSEAKPPVLVDENSAEREISLTIRERYSMEVLPDVVVLRGEKGSPGIRWMTFTFPSASTTWRIRHGQGVRRYVLQARDAQGVLTVVSHEPVSDDEIVVYLEEPMSGTAEVAFEARV